MKQHPAEAAIAEQIANAASFTVCKRLWGAATLQPDGTRAIYSKWEAPTMEDAQRIADANAPAIIYALSKATAGGRPYTHCVGQSRRQPGAKNAENT